MPDPIVKRGPLSSKVGVEVSEVAVSLLANAETEVATLAGNVPLTRFAREGGFDGARLQVLRFYAASPQSEACGSLNMFEGTVAEVRVSATKVDLTVNSDLERLNVQFPRNVYESQCIHTLYDDRCGANAALRARTGTVAAGGSALSVPATFNGSVSTGVFDLGTITFTSGQNNGVVRTVSVFVASNGTAGAANVALALPYAPAPGDTFVARGGCDKLYATCDTRWVNTANFRGYEFIPVPESTY